jgi:aldehyde:ferredoxin oxidoreductase
MIKGGYNNKLLRVNLTDKKISSEPIAEEDSLLYLGGRGIAVRYLYKEVRPKTDPLGPENKIIFSIGPLTGSTVPCCSRYAVVSKSPLTGYTLHAFAGGYWAAELKWAGYDMIIVEGVSEEPCYLLVSDEQTEIKSARKLWGCTTMDTERIIKHDLNDDNVKILSIGPAGERMVRFAGIISDLTSRRSGSASRCGGGAIMGSKKLKAIVVKGKIQVKISNPEFVKQSIRNILTVISKNPTVEQFSKRGTTRGVHIINEALGIFPTRNFQTGFFEEADGIGPEEFEKRFVKHVGCYICPIRCSKIRLIKSGPYAGMTKEGPEYETIALLGSNCGNGDADTVLSADYLCDGYGLDTISTGACISFLLELNQRGLISKEQADGLDLSWGNKDTIITLIRKIAFREGIGDFLADGVKKASEKLGEPTRYYAMHVKGLEMPGYDPRAAQGHGLGIGTSNRGACHERGFCTQELYGWPTKPPSDRFSVEGKGKLVKENQDKYAIFDSTVTCFFASFHCPESYALALQGVTGVEEFGKFSYLIGIGERIWNLERAFNIREGLTKDEDNIPERFKSVPMPNGSAKGQVSHWNELLEQYYEARGYDRETGYPRKSKLKELKLDYVIKDLEKLNIPLSE